MREIVLASLLMVAGCAQKPVEVPVVVERKLPPRPDECVTKHPVRLTPMPKAKDGDRIEDYVAAAGRVHRQNDKQYRSLRSDHSVCETYVNGLQSNAKR